MTEGQRDAFASALTSGVKVDNGCCCRPADVILRERGLRLSIDTGDLDVGDVRTGDSIAVNGACLTVVERDAAGIKVDVSEETLRCTARYSR